MDEKATGYHVHGVYEVLDDTTLKITELPVGKWTRDYKNFLEELAAKDVVENINEYHQENRVHFELDVPKLREYEALEGGIEKKFKLLGSIPTTNMVAFSPEGKITRYQNECDILKEFFTLREDLYGKRKAYMLARLLRDYEILVNKVRFIQLVISEELKINRVKKAVILVRLQEHGLKPMSWLKALLHENPAFLKIELEK